jgi:hypothetical protein
MPKARASKRGKSKDERQVEAEWAEVDFEAIEPVRLDLDPVLRERIRSRDKLVQITLRIGADQIAEAKREAATSKQKYQAILRRWLAEGAARARTERLRHQ